jgi:hypothetical protein
MIMTESIAKRKQARIERRIAKREEKRNMRLTPLDNIKNVTNRDNLVKAFRKARQGVAWKQSVQNYERDLATNIEKAAQKVEKRNPVHDHFNQFVINERGKVRHIRSVNIDERVVQKALCDEIIIPALTPTLIYDNGACLQGKGTSFSEKRLKTHLRQYYKDHGTNEGYVLNTDFRKYFDNIDHNILIERISRYIKDPRVIGLITHFIRSFNEGSDTENGKSIGLGSQISQIAAVYFPNCVDHYAKEVLRASYYGRYMDDIYILHHDKEYLINCLRQIKEICKDLKLELNMKKTSITKITSKKGVLFLKGHYHLLSTGRIIVRPSKDSFRREKRKIKKWKHKLIEGSMTLEACMMAYKSWRGSFMKRFKDAKGLMQRMDEHFERIIGYKVN